MSRRIDFTLTDEQLAAVEHSMNHSPLPEVRQRWMNCSRPLMGLVLRTNLSILIASIPLSTFN